MFCQNCKTPLKLDSSLENLSPAAYNILLDATSRTEVRGSDSRDATDSRRSLSTSQQQHPFQDVAAQNDQTPTFRRNTTTGAPSVTIPSAYGEAGSKASRDHAAMSFVMLTESQVHSAALISNEEEGNSSDDPRRRRGRFPENVDEDNLLSHKMEISARLFEILSSRSDVDHPVCVECTNILIDGMEKRLSSTSNERDAYVNFLREANANMPTDDERAQVEQELKMLEEQEKVALQELETLESEKANLEKELAALELETRRLDEEEQEFWRERNALSMSLSSLQHERDSVNLRYDHDSRQMDRLSRTNVYNDTFNISYDGPFGTINGLRLGKMPNVPVEWSEINAALGQCCLLLATVLEKLEFQLQGYRLNPVGSTSTVDKLDPGLSQQSSMHSASGYQSDTRGASASLPLFHSSDLPLNIGFLHRNFDNALVAFLECVRQAFKHVERSTDNKIKTPYEIRKDKFQNKDRPDQEVSIKLGFGGDESWTKACKCLLTCLKFLLAHASHMEK